MEFSDGLGGNYLISFHVKLRKISDITATCYLPSSISCKISGEFIVSELGRIYAQLPLKEMEVKHRIVSIDRPYIRPIVRGKENKRVEFGAKVNNRQNDGISFIEHHSFETFNEGVRLKESIIIGTLRSTVMEGSFGNQKQHYKVVAYSGT